jgi:hypothetical protein
MRLVCRTRSTLIRSGLFNDFRQTAKTSAAFSSLLDHARKREGTGVARQVISTGIVTAISPFEFDETDGSNA